MNDPKAFYDKYKSLVYNLALNYSTNKEDAAFSPFEIDGCDGKIKL